MAKTYPEYEYDLDDRLLAGLREEFEPKTFIKSLAKQLATVPENEQVTVYLQLLKTYAHDLAKRTIELGNKYKDRTAEVIEEVAAKTGISFPSLPQRFLEIAMLATRPEDKWKINEASTKRFIFTVNSCTFRQALVEELGHTYSCHEGCLTLLETIYHELNLEVEVSFNFIEGSGCRFVSTFISR